jgi:hypothetical protein
MHWPMQVCIKVRRRTSLSSGHPSHEYSAMISNEPELGTLWAHKRGNTGSIPQWEATMRGNASFRFALAGVTTGIRVACERLIAADEVEVECDPAQEWHNPAPSDVLRRVVDGVATCDE